MALQTRGEALHRNRVDGSPTTPQQSCAELRLFLLLLAERPKRLFPATGLPNAPTAALFPTIWWYDHHDRMRACSLCFQIDIHDHFPPELEGRPCPHATSPSDLVARNPTRSPHRSLPTSHGLNPEIPGPPGPAMMFAPLQIPIRGIDVFFDEYRPIVQIHFDPPISSIHPLSYLIVFNSNIGEGLFTSGDPTASPPNMSFVVTTHTFMYNSDQFGLD